MERGPRARGPRSAFWRRVICLTTKCPGSSDIARIHGRSGMRGFRRVVRGVAICGLVSGGLVPLAALDVDFAQDQLRGAAPAGQQEQGEPWREALVAIPVAAALGAALAFRPIRRGTPPRDPAVIQTQIVLAVIGAIIMLVVGASLARAFGI